MQELESRLGKLSDTTEQATGGGGRQRFFRYPVGAEIRGHEFRYSRVEGWSGSADSLAFRMERGVGFADGGDGLVFKNVLALYTHIHALGTPAWAPALVARAQVHRQERR